MPCHISDGPQTPEDVCSGGGEPDDAYDVARQAEVDDQAAKGRRLFELGYLAAFDDWGREETHISDISAAMEAAWRSRKNP